MTKHTSTTVTTLTANVATAARATKTTAAETTAKASTVACKTAAKVTAAAKPTATVASIMILAVLSLLSLTAPAAAQVIHRQAGQAGQTVQAGPAEVQHPPYQPGYIPMPEPIVAYTADDIQIRKEFQYDKYTLADEYPYGKTTRRFQWDKIKAGLAHLETIQRSPSAWAMVQNRKNVNGQAPLTHDAQGNEYNNAADRFGVERYQGIPLYDTTNLSSPVRYAYDGSLVKLTEYVDTAEYVAAEAVFIEGDWMIPAKYVKPIDTKVTRFDKTIFIDRTNQNICTLEKRGDEWVVLSMNPATTGANNPPIQKETPLGIFVVQEKKEKMIYLTDSGSDYGGFAPWASRFCNGGYIHGVPVNAPGTNIIEWSATLGTIPRSHMCVRNATSHAQFVFDWAPVGQALVFVIK